MRRRGWGVGSGGWVAAFLMGCGSAGADAAPAAPGPMTVVAVDLSTSRSAAKVREDRTLLLGIVESLGHGERFALLEVDRDGPESGARRWIGDMPPARRVPPEKGDVRRLAERQAEVRSVVEAFFADSGSVRQIPRTDLLSTIATAAELVAEAERPSARVVVLSDMLNATPALNLEAGAVPGASWIARQKAVGLIPDLSGVCVGAIGGDARTERGVAVREFWRGWFEAAGARIVYRHTATDGGRVGC